MTMSDKDVPENGRGCRCAGAGAGGERVGSGRRAGARYPGVPRVEGQLPDRPGPEPLPGRQHEDRPGERPLLPPVRMRPARSRAVHHAVLCPVFRRAQERGAVPLHPLPRVRFSWHGRVEKLGTDQLLNVSKIWIVPIGLAGPGRSRHAHRTRRSARPFCRVPTPLCAWT